MDRGLVLIRGWENNWLGLFFPGIFRAARSIFAFSKLAFGESRLRARLRVIGRYAIRAPGQSNVAGTIKNGIIPSERFF